MAIAHTYTPRGLVKIGLGSNEFNNPYRGPWNTSMDIIDTELHDDELYRTAVQGVNGVLVGDGSGGFSALSPEPLSPAFEDAPQVGRYYPITGSVADIIYQRVFSANYITLYPVIWPIKLANYGSWSMAIGVYTAYSAYAEIDVYTDYGGYPNSLINRSFLINCDSTGVKEASGWHNDIGTLNSLQPGQRLWIGIRVTSSGSPVLNLYAYSYVNHHAYGGCGEDGRIGTGVALAWDTEPPAVFPVGGTITSERCPIIYLKV